MKILPVSDLHLEFHLDGGQSFVSRLPEADVLVVAGDLTDAPALPGALKMLSRKYPDVVFVPGNHEYYRGTQAMGLRAKDGRPPNVHWLDRDVVTLGDTRFVGCTLWFPDTPEARANTNRIGDFTHIKGTDWIWKEFELNRSFLGAEVTPSDIVVTHHLPSPKSIAPKYKNDPLNCYFLGDVRPLIRSKVWIHGHTHEPCDYLYSNPECNPTRVFCNPTGYPSERHGWQARYL